MRRALMFVAGMLAGQWLAFGATSPPAALRAEGAAAFDRGDYAAAARLWSRATALHPDDPHLHFLRATALARLGHRQSAADALEQSLLLEPPAEIARRARAELSSLASVPVDGEAESAVLLEPVRGVWIVPVLLNGAHRGRFMVDTGASITIVAPALARAAGVAPGSATDAVELHTLGGRTVGTAVTLASIRVGDAELRDAAAVVHDPGAGVDGILGNSFLGRYRLTLDADQRLLHLRSLARP